MIDNIVEFFFTTGLFINAALYLPQIYRLLKKKSSEDISLIMFLGFNMINFFIVWHGIIKNDVLLLLGYGVTLLVNTIVTVLIIFYRVNPKSK